jgi:hypothetical protein
MRTQIFFDDPMFNFHCWLYKAAGTYIVYISHLPYILSYIVGSMSLKNGGCSVIIKNLDT